MPAPPEFRDAFTAALMAALPRLIEKAWATTEKKAASATVRPARRASGPAHRIEKGRTRLALQVLLDENQKTGLSRADIRRLIVHQLDIDGPISENTLRKALMDLRAAGKIETRNSRWFPASVQMSGPVKTRPQAKSIEGFDYPK